MENTVKLGDNLKSLKFNKTDTNESVSREDAIANRKKVDSELRDIFAGDTRANISGFYNGVDSTDGSIYVVDFTARGEDNLDEAAELLEDEYKDKLSAKGYNDIEVQVGDVGEEWPLSLWIYCKDVELEESLKMNESMSKYADTDAQGKTIDYLDRLAKRLGISLRFGTKVGKYPQSVVLDHNYQDNAIYISSNGSFEIKNKRFGDYRDEDFDLSSIDKKEVRKAIMTLNDKKESCYGKKCNEEINSNSEGLLRVLELLGDAHNDLIEASDEMDSLEYDDEDNYISELAYAIEDAEAELSDIDFMTEDDPEAAAHSKFEESLKEGNEDWFDREVHNLDFDEVIDWLEEHEQACKDCKSFFKVDDLSKLDIDKVVDWLYDHKELMNDFKNNFFEESLKEAKEDKKELDLKSILKIVTDYTKLVAGKEVTDEQVDEFIDNSGFDKDDVKKIVDTVEGVVDEVKSAEEPKTDLKSVVKLDDEDAEFGAEVDDTDVDDFTMNIADVDVDKKLEHSSMFDFDDEVEVTDNVEDMPDDSCDDEECDKKDEACDKCNEDVKVITDLSEFKPWGQAVDLWDEINDKGLLDEFDFTLEDMYPEGITATELNDLLAYDSKFVRDMLLMDEKHDYEDDDYE